MDVRVCTSELYLINQQAIWKAGECVGVTESLQLSSCVSVSSSSYIVFKTVFKNQEAGKIKNKQNCKIKIRTF